MLHERLYTFVSQRFFSYLGFELRQLLRGCYVHLGIQGLIIEAPDEEIADKLYDYAEELTVAAYRFAFAKIVLVKVGSEDAYSLPTDLVLRIQSSIIMNQKTLILPGDIDLRQEIDEYSGGASIVRMLDHKGLACNNRIIESSGSRPNDWVGQDMSRFWVESELARFIATLERDNQVSEFVYQAFLFDGTRSEFYVDARLVNYRGDICRLVKTRGCRPL